MSDAVELLRAQVRGIPHQTLVTKHAQLSRQMQREEDRFGGKPGSSEPRARRDLVEAVTP